jgi:opacity protein-like surface antigen
VGRWLVHGGRVIKYVVLANSDAGYKNHQDLPTDSPDEPNFQIQMKKFLAAVSTACVALCAPVAHAQAQNFAGFSAAINADFATTKTTANSRNQTPSYGFEASDGDTSLSLQAQYNMAFGESMLLGLGATVALGDTKAGNLGGVSQLKMQDAYSLYVAPGYAINPKWMVYGKLAYLSAKVKNDFATVNFDSGVGLGLGLQTMLAKHVYAQVEYMSNTYDEKSSMYEADKAKSDVFSVGVGYRFYRFGPMKS